MATLIKLIRMRCSRAIKYSGKARQSSLERITVNPEHIGGRPCTRGIRILVTDLLDLYAAGPNATQSLEEMHNLEPEDLQAALRTYKCLADIEMLEASDTD